MSELCNASIDHSAVRRRALETVVDRRNGAFFQESA